MPRLYTAGMTRQSIRAIENVKAICETHLQGRVDLAVINWYQKPALADDQEVIAAPLDIAPDKE